ncbi:MAG TPA: anti-sigma factor [Pyrinomonadaceae bacterium]|nr:anti-sigma factor [Pyrinomonadaceae bacterium]
MKHEDYKEMLAAAALDSLDGRERRALDAHLAECEECRAELSALTDAAASLAYTTVAVAPAPELRARILARVKSGSQQDGRGATANDAATTDGATNAVSNVTSLDAYNVRRDMRKVTFSRPTLMFGTLAASVAIAALVMSLALLWQRNNRLQAEVAQLSNTVSQTQQELARTREDRQLLAAPEAQTATLAGTKMAERAQARLTYDARTGRAMLMASDLPPAPAGKAYQLWFIAAGKPPMPGSVFTPDSSGHAELHDVVPPEGRRAAVFAVTLEPAGGVGAPTGEMYLKSSAAS